MNYYLEKKDTKLHKRLSPLFKYFNYNEDISKTNFIIYPEIIWGKSYLETIKIIFSFMIKYKKYIIENRKVIFFLNCDFRDPLYLKNTIIFRTSIEYSKLQVNERILPIIWPEKLGKFTYFLDQNNPLPIVGFCGCLDTNEFRKIVSDLIKNNKEIQDNFILRNTFLATDIPDKEQTKNDFYKNINESHFTLCLNGFGNFSIRFYQTLSMGRIPIFLETDTILPFKNEIDWENTIIMDKNPKNLVEKIIYCYQNEDIIKKQKKCLEIFNKYFTFNAFSLKMRDLIK